jgi:predicted ATPase
VSSLFTRLGLDPPVLAGDQEVRFNQIAVYAQGAGLRGLFSILSALTTGEVQLLLIDEPELGLEPQLQRALRDVPREEARERMVIIATHSHLFLNREDPSANYVMRPNNSYGMRPSRR